MVLSDFFSCVYNTLCYSLMDITVFVFVDLVAKSMLKEAHDEGQKKTIWLYEFLVLLGISLLIYVGFGRIPLFLIVLTFATLIVTQCLNRESLTNYWHRWQTFRDEYKQHQESIQRDQKLSANQLGYQSGAQTKKHGFIARLLEKVATVSGLFSSGPEGQGTPSVGPGGIGLNQAQYNSTRPDIGVENPQAHPQVTVRWRGQGGQPGSPEVRHPHATQSVNTYSVPNAAGPVAGENTALQTRALSTSSVLQPSLARKPLRGYEARKQNLSLKSKMLSALGINPYVCVPPGLKNRGQNLCFMNCVLQCLARTPHLSEQLSKEVYEEASCSVAESAFLSALTDLLRYCNTNPGTSDVTALDPVALQKAASCLPGSPIVAAGRQQIQQDASEFLMWLLSIVHAVLNKNKRGKENMRGGRGQQERFSSASLAMLKFLYGNLDAVRIQELKQACRREINMANGLQNESYAEPIQRLSDLEWLTYKEDNSSIVDDLFTGQLIEAFHCLSDHHISVHMQTFIVLPVPVVAPREVSGIVHLEDCFAKFCNTEHLIGPEGVQCSMCDQGLRSPIVRSPVSNPSATVNTPTPNYRPHPLLRKTVLHMRDSAVGEMSMMSPIANTNTRSCMPINDSGFHDAHFRTSTPIQQKANGGVSPMSPPPRIRLRDAQRRCLLRQLPDCLVIQVMRFAMNMHMGDIRKIRAPLHVPLKNLNLSHLIFDAVTERQDMTAAQNYKYDLYAMCTHLGGESTSYGHYVAYCRNGDGTWYKFDDEDVTDVNMDYELTTKELRENSYLLFYRRHQSESEGSR